MKKVLIVANDGLEIGGIQVVIMSIVRKLHAEYTFDLVSFSNSKTYFEEEFLSYGGRIFHISRYTGNSVFRRRLDFYIRFPYLYFEIQKILSNNKYDAIHCHIFFEAGIFLLAANKARVPVRICHSHDKMSGKKINCIREIYECFYRNIIMKNATVKIGCSKPACEYLYGEQKAIVVNNGIDLNEFCPKKYKQDMVNKFRFIQVGRFAEKKNYIFSLRVFKIIHAKIKEAELVLIGEGEMEEELRATVRQMELSEFTHFLPANADIPLELAKSNYMLFPSTYEGLGIVAIEAQAMNVLCFASTGVPDEADCGMCVFLDLNKGPQYWADTIMEYMNNKNDANCFSDMRKYDIKEIAEMYKKIYDGKYYE